MSTLTTLPPLSLYIHIPWCIRKCPYCDFNSHQQNGELPEQDYIKALIQDLQQDSAYIQGRELQSIFIGGGTPSLFSARAFGILMEAMNEIAPFSKNIEITMEANPGTFEQQKFSDFRHAGINRLSIGIQSFQRNFLQALGRVHDEREALAATEIAYNAGFENLNLDLMYGLPEQNVQQALDDLEIASSLQATHLSWYQLTIEPNTAFYSHPPTRPDEELIDSMQTEGQALLENRGFRRYEISAYAKKGFQSRHNLNYWSFGDYLGIGAGAHGKITLPEQGRIIRTRKTRQPAHYLDPDKNFMVEEKVIATKDLPLEFMMNAMRLVSGSDVATFEQRTGLNFSVIEEQVANLRKQGLLYEDALKPSERGLNLLNDLLQSFVP